MSRLPPSSFRGSSNLAGGLTGRRCAGIWESGTRGSCTELICRSDEPAGVLETAGLLPCGSGVTRRKTCSGVPSGAGGVSEGSARCTRAGETGVLLCDGVSDGLLGGVIVPARERGAGHCPLCCV